MTNQQGAPEAPTDFERRHAIRQGHEIAASDSYFDARPQIDNNDRRKVFQAGFERGWDRHAALVDAQQPAPSAAAAGQRRSDLVPGVMHCAKCKFQLNRITLCVSDGNAYAGNNETELCPNGCGPLWPVTWEQEARNCWKALEEMHERLHPAPTPQADSQPAPEYVGNGMFKGETIEKAAEHWANWCDVRCMTGLSEFLRVVAARATADSVTAPAGDPLDWPLPCDITAGSVTISKGCPLRTVQTRLKVQAEANWLLIKRMRREMKLATPPTQAADSVTEDAGPSKSLPYEPTSAMLIAALERDPALPIETVRAIYWSMWRTAPTPPTHAADSVLEDAARLEIESLKAQIAAALPGQQDYPESPMKKVAQALREKAEAERGAFDRRIQSGEWGPEPEPDTEADSWVLPEPVSDVWTTFRGERCLTPAGDDYYTSVQVRAAYEAGLAAPPTAQAAPAAQGDAARESEYQRGYRHGYEQRDAEVRGALA